MTSYQGRTKIGCLSRYLASTSNKLYSNWEQVLSSGDTFKYHTMDAIIQSKYYSMEYIPKLIAIDDLNEQKKFLTYNF